MAALTMHTIYADSLILWPERVLSLSIESLACTVRVLHVCGKYQCADSCC